MKDIVEASLAKAVCTYHEPVVLLFRPEHEVSGRALGITLMHNVVAQAMRRLIPLNWSIADNNMDYMRPNLALFFDGYTYCPQREGL